MLNEFASVASRKQRMPWTEIVDTLGVSRSLCLVLPLTVEMHGHALRLVGNARAFSVFAGMIVASALSAGCDTLYSEDMQHGRRIENRLTIRNPFL